MLQVIFTEESYSTFVKEGRKQLSCNNYLSYEIICNDWLSRLLAVVFGRLNRDDTCHLVLPECHFYSLIDEMRGPKPAPNVEVGCMYTND